MKLLSRKKEFLVKVTALSLIRLLLLGVVALAFVLTVPARAQDFDAYKVRLSGFWAYSTPSEACKDPLTAGRSIYNKISGSTATRHLSARSTRSLPAKTICILLRRRSTHGKPYSIERSTSGANLRRWRNHPEQSKVKSVCPRIPNTTLSGESVDTLDSECRSPLCCFGEDQCDAPNRQWRAVRNGERMVAGPDPRGWAGIPPLPDQLANFLWKATSTGCTSAGMETLSRRSIRLGGF